MSVDFDVLLAKASSVRKHLDRVTEKCDVSVKAFLKNGPERQQKMPVATQWRSRSSEVYPVAPMVPGRISLGKSAPKQSVKITPSPPLRSLSLCGSAVNSFLGKSDCDSLLKKCVRRIQTREFGRLIHTLGAATLEFDLDICITIPEMRSDDRVVVSDIAWEVGFTNDMPLSTIVIPEKDCEQGPASASPFLDTIRNEGVAA